MSHLEAVILPAVFALIAATVVLHGFSLAPLARRLGLTLGNRPGLAIVGATPWSIALAAALQDAGTPVLLIDIFPGALAEARKRRLPVLQAEILSEHGEEGLSFRRVDYLLAATQNDVYNSFVCVKLAPDIGRGRIFQLAPAGGHVDEWIGLDREWRGQVLGLPPVDFSTMQRRFDEGWQFQLVGDDEAPPPDAPAPDGIGLIVVRKNGDLALRSIETTAAAVGAGDRALILAPIVATPPPEPVDEAEPAKA